MMTTLQEAIDRLGKDLIKCNDCCAGLWVNRRAGIIPRGLFLERPTAKGRGSFAVGLNPGTSSPKEREIYRAEGITLQVVQGFRESISDHPYFKRSRAIIDQLGLSGPILWSNLAKCENGTDRKGLPPLQTLRHCTQRFLRRELTAVPSKWVVLGIGWEAYRALAYLVPDRAVIIIPHPTGGFRDFRKLLSGGVLLRDVKNRAIKAMNARELGAARLGVQKPGA